MAPFRLRTVKGPPSAPDLKYVVAMSKAREKSQARRGHRPMARMSPTWLLTGEGADVIDSDRPRAELHVALHDYVASELLWNCDPDEILAIVDKLPPGKVLLELFAEYYWMSVVAPALDAINRARLTELVRDARDRQHSRKTIAKSGAPDALRSGRRAFHRQPDLESMESLSGRIGRPRSFAPRSKGKITKIRAPKK